MTCIVGLVDGKNVYIGGDSAAVAGQALDTSSNSKVFTNEEFLMGYTSSFRMGQILQYKFNPPSLYEDQSRLMEYMVTDFIDAVRDCFKDTGFAETDSGRESGGLFLVGIQGRLFEIHSDYQVFESSRGYSAVGSGETAANGSLYTSEHFEVKPHERIQYALEASVSHTTSVHGPFTILSI